MTWPTPERAAGGAPLGLVAGSGALPLALARSARARGRRVVAVALRGEADPALAGEVDACFWRRTGGLGAIIRALRGAGVHEACLLGGVQKRRWLDGLHAGWPDWTALQVLWRLGRREDDQLLRAIAAVFESRGIRIVGSAAYLPDCTAAGGPLGRHLPGPQQRQDLSYGLRICRTLGHLDVGQCVAVHRGVVLALEALEGTDACIARAGSLCRGGGFSVVKAAKPQQDMRFDVPTVGPATIEALQAAGGRALGIEAGRVLVASPQATLRAADRAGIALYGLGSDSGGSSSGRQAPQPSTDSAWPA